MDEKTYHDILLKEYAEAGNLCRNCEQLTRTSLSVSLPLVSAIAGVLLSQKIYNSLMSLGLSVVGIAVCLVFLNTIYRTRAYYLHSLARVKEIEKLIVRDEKPVMSLYTSGKDATVHSKTFSNKLTLAVVLWLALLYFVGSAAVNACASCRIVLLYQVVRAHAGYAAPFPVVMVAARHNNTLRVFKCKSSNSFCSWFCGIVDACCTPVKS